MIATAPLAKAVQIADDARNISIITTIESWFSPGTNKAGEKQASNFLFSIIICRSIFIIDRQIHNFCLKIFIPYAYKYSGARFPVTLTEIGHPYPLFHHG